MTPSEKEQLRRRVLQLPRDKLSRATEIIGLREGSEAESYHVIFAGSVKAINQICECIKCYAEIIKPTLYYHLHALSGRTT